MVISQKNIIVGIKWKQKKKRYLNVFILFWVNCT